MPTPHYLYILRSLGDDRIYVGVTNNVERRLKEHNAGRARGTKPWRPWELVYTEQHPDERSAGKTGHAMIQSFNMSLVLVIPPR